MECLSNLPRISRPFKASISLQKPVPSIRVVVTPSMDFHEPIFFEWEKVDCSSRSMVSSDPDKFLLSHRGTLI